MEMNRNIYLYYKLVSITGIILLLLIPDGLKANNKLNNLIIAGNYHAARELGRQLSSADSLAIACRMGLIIGGYFEVGKPAILSLHNAIDDCRHALLIDQTHLIANVSLALAIGFEGKRRTNPFLARKSKRLIKATLKQYPNNAIAIGALAGWHAEVSDAGVLARLTLGAHSESADKYFSHALDLDKNNITTRFEYIKFLLRNNNMHKAKKELNTLFQHKPTEAFEHKSLQIAAELSDLIKTQQHHLIIEKIQKSSAFFNIKNYSNYPAYSFNTLKKIPIHN